MESELGYSSGDHGIYKKEEGLSQLRSIKYKGKTYKFTGRFFGMGYDWPFYRCGKYMMVWKLKKGYPVCEFVYNG